MRVTTTLIFGALATLATVAQASGDFERPDYDENQYAGLGDEYDDDDHTGHDGHHDMKHMHDNGYYHSGHGDHEYEHYAPYGNPDFSEDPSVGVFRRNEPDEPFLDGIFPDPHDDGHTSWSGEYGPRSTGYPTGWPGEHPKPGEHHQKGEHHHKEHHKGEHHHKNHHKGHYHTEIHDPHSHHGHQSVEDHNHHSPHTEQHHTGIHDHGYHSHKHHGHHAPSGTQTGTSLFPWSTISTLHGSEPTDILPRHESAHKPKPKLKPKPKAHFKSFWGALGPREVEPEDEDMNDLDPDWLSEDEGAYSQIWARELANIDKNPDGDDGEREDELESHDESAAGFFGERDAHYDDDVDPEWLDDSQDGYDEEEDDDEPSFFDHNMPDKAKKWTGMEDGHEHDFENDEPEKKSGWKFW